QQYFERKIYQKKSDKIQLQESIHMEELAIKEQIGEINRLRQKNAQPSFFSKVMVVAPNATLIGKSTSFDFLYIPGNKSFFKKREAQEGHEFSIHLRGYTNDVTNSVVEEGWFEVIQNGKE